MIQNYSTNTKLVLFVSLSILFLALNSIFCKLALQNNSIDPYSFTLLRLLFASITLVILVKIKHKEITLLKKDNWITSSMLFIYAISFSYAYINIDAGFGALLLFGVVQIAMIVSSLLNNEKLSLLKILGVMISLIGLVYLVYPKNDFNISLYHSFLMIIAGFAWAIYSVLGKKSTDALGNTTDNFLKATFFIIIFYFLFDIDKTFLTQEGLLLAALSGSITSALGYIIWYTVLPQLQIITASVVQLFVPVVAIIISVLFLDEILSFELLFSTILIIIGILLTIYTKKIQKV